MAAHAHRGQPDIPPSLPPRPRGGNLMRAPQPVPPDDDDSDPDDMYDDFEEDKGSAPNQEEVYDDFDEPPPLPPPYNHGNEPEIYDDCDEQDSPPPPPQRPAVRNPPVSPPAAPQETYDDLENVGPIVQQIHKRNLPPPPPPVPSHHPPPKQEASPYEMDDLEDDKMPPPPPPEPVESVYEVEPEVEPALPRPPPPAPAPSSLPLPPKNQRPPVLPPQPTRTAASPGPKSAASPSPIAIGLDQLQSAKAGLRKVSLDEESANHDPKEYGECPQSVSDVKKKFQKKMEGKPEVLSPKPALLPKGMAGKSPANNDMTKHKTLNSESKPVPAVQQTKAASPSVPEVTFLTKASKDKQPNMPPAASTPKQPFRPVAKVEPQPEEFDDPDEIYDDAASADLLDRYDWYHGKIDRSKGESRVKGIGKDGTYLVRVSEKDPMYPYTLVVFHRNQVNNFRIRQRTDNKIALGDEKSDELAFDDVPALINHHKEHHVLLLGTNQSQVKLQHVPPKR